MPSVNYAECRKQAHYAKCRYAKCRCDECRYAECRGTGLTAVQIQNQILEPANMHFLIFLFYFQSFRGGCIHNTFLQ
jgi:hypothetical protein